MSPELIGILGVGVAVLGLGWKAYHSLSQDMATVKERLAHIEGWIQGRFNEGTG